MALNSVLRSSLRFAVTTRRSHALPSPLLIGGSSCSRSLAVLSLLSLLTLGAPSPARAQGAQADTYTVSYSGGATTAVGPTDFSTGPYTPASAPDQHVPAGNAYGGSASNHQISSGNTVTVNCKEAVTATFTWNGGPNTDPAPAAGSVIVVEQVNAGWNGQTGSVGSDLPGGTTSGSPASQTYAATRYSVKGGGSFTATCTPTASASSTAPPGGYSGVSASVGYTATPYAVTINPIGAVQDTATGSYHILIGQKCAPALVGIPSNCIPSNLSWTATGNTVQENSWNPSPDSTTATFSGLVNPYTFTQTTASSTPPHWYWDDNTGSKTITCTATVTPPNGAAFSITATVEIKLDEPLFTNPEPVGKVQLNTNYPNSLDPTLYPGAADGAKVGILFTGTVTTPTTAPFSGGGTWFHTQLITLSRTAIPKGGGAAVSLPGDAVPGALDYISNPAVVYDSIFNADGQSGSVYPNEDSDEPSQPVTDTYQEYKITNESFTDYIMYTPPGSDSIRVPLASFTWKWNADVTDVPRPGKWSLWNNAPVTSGTITASGAAVRTLNYPVWGKVVNN